MIPEISASKLAGFIGLHKFQNQNEVFYELLCKDKTVAAQIAEIEKVNHRRPFNKVLNEVMRESAIQDCVQTGLRACESTDNVQGVLADVQSAAGIVLNLRHDSYPEELRNRLAVEIGGAVSKRRGTRNEAAILDTYEAARNVRVIERNTRTVRKDCGTYTLVGRTDGYVASENRIVDSKERTRFWPSVPIYDEIQLRAYMFMTDAAESELVERFPDGTARHTKYMNDPEKWKSIHDAIEKSVERIHEATENVEALKRIVFANTVCVSA